MTTSPISAVFDNQAQVETAIDNLRAAGIPDSAYSIIGRDGAHNEEGHGIGAGEPGDDVAETTPVVRGLIGGGALGALLGVAALAIPGVGPFVAMGAVAAAATPAAMATGALIGASAAGIGEALTHHGIKAEDAEFYGNRLNDGGILLMVDTSAPGIEASQIVQILRDSGGHQASASAAAVPTETALA